jgi:DNA-binding transcriptional MerR regulator
MAIGVFSERSGLSAKRLRTYATEGLLTPAAVDPGSGYRYYSPGQLVEALVIDALRHAGVPLADIRAFLGQPSQEQLAAWATRLETDANHRQEALILARRLLAASEDPSLPITDPHSKERHMTSLRTAGRTDIGRLRENNEDVIVSSDRLALVADGMGGHPGGEVAANVAAAVVPAAFTGQSLEELEATIRAANWAIRDRAVAQPGLEGMGTTICAVGLLVSGQLALVNVGDSRAYLWRGGALKQLTQDHSVTAELIKRGELRKEEAAEHPYYGVLTRALGVGPECQGSVEAFRDMELFVDTVGDARTADRLAAAIGGRGAFRRFKDTLSAWPAETHRWYAYSEERQRGRAREWLAENGYYASAPSESRHPAATNDPCSTRRSGTGANPFEFVQYV